MAEEHGLDIPENWKVNRYEFTGQFRLIAQFTERYTGEVLNIVPYRNYGQSNYLRSHRITLTRGDSVEVIAENTDVKHPEEAKAVAIKVMKEINQAKSTD